MLTGNLRCISKELTGSINAATANPEAQKPLRTLQTEGKGQASAVDIDGPVDAGSCEGTDTRQDHKSRAPSLHGTMNRGRWDSRCWFLGKGTTHDSSTNTADPSPWPRHCRDVQQAGRDDVLQQPAKGEEQQQGRQSQTQRRQPNASTIPGACHNQEAATHSHDRSCEHQDLPQVHRSRWLQSPSPGHPIPLLGLQQLPCRPCLLLNLLLLLSVPLIRRNSSQAVPEKFSPSIEHVHHPPRLFPVAESTGSRLFFRPASAIRKWHGTKRDYAIQGCCDHHS